MFKAINKQNAEEIVALDPRWVSKIEDLRLLDRQDILVCQECQQPVRIRAGMIRQHHFAHKHRQDCPYQNESPQLLKARAILYQWLSHKFDDKIVTLEKKIEEAFFPRPIDCWVEGKYGSIAYWLVEERMKPQLREYLQLMFDRINVKVNWVFLSDMLHEDTKEEGKIFLSTTEREMACQSQYDRILHPLSFDPGKTIHYLDYDNGMLTTFRALRQVHAPQVFEGHKVSHSLSQLLVSPKTGEFVHPGEHEELQQLKRDEITSEGKQEYASQGGHPPPGSISTGIDWKKYRDDSTDIQRSIFEGEKPTCKICGKITDDWGILDRSKNKCICRDCLYSERR